MTELRALVADLPPADAAMERAARAHDAQLTKPPGALARLEDIAAFMAAWQGVHPPRAEDVRVLVFAGNHGIAGRGVSAFPADVTAQMVANFSAGGAAINQLCAAVGAALDVEALDLESPTADFTAAPAMSEAELLAAIAAGRAKVPKTADIICVGEMGIGNTTAAAAICHALFAGAAEDWVGSGTGVDAAGRERKAAVIRTAIAFHGRALDDPLEGPAPPGRAGARGYRRRGARSAPQPHPRHARRLRRRRRGGAAFRHEPGGARPLPGGLSLRRIGPWPVARDLRQGAPLLDLGMRLGEASGATLAVAIVKAAVAVHGGMATLAEAGVSDKD